MLHNWSMVMTKITFFSHLRNFKPLSKEAITSQRNLAISVLFVQWSGGKTLSQYLILFKTIIDEGVVDEFCNLILSLY